MQRIGSSRPGARTRTLGPLEHVAKLTFRFEKVPTYQRTREGEERFVHTRTTLVAESQATESMQPGQRAFDHPARPTEPTAMGRTAFGELGLDAAPLEGV